MPRATTSPEARRLLALSIVARLPAPMLSIGLLVHAARLTGSFAAAGPARQRGRVRHRPGGRAAPGQPRLAGARDRRRRAPARGFDAWLRRPARPARLAPHPAPPRLGRRAALGRDADAGRAVPPARRP